MKIIRSIMGIVLFSLSISAFAQTDKKTTAKIVADKHYTFIANAANPTGSMALSRVMSSMNRGQGGRIDLSGSMYDFKVTKDSLVAYLPYFGRAYSAPISPSEGGIKFTSKNFSYKESKSKKGNYIISIQTNDLNPENYTLNLTISPSGYASLSANSNNKQTIYFDGYLEDPSAKKK